MKKISVFFDRSFQINKYPPDQAQKAAMEAVFRFQRIIALGKEMEPPNESDALRKLFHDGWEESNDLVLVAKAAQRIEILVSSRGLPLDNKGGRAVRIEIQFFLKGQKDRRLGGSICFGSLGEVVFVDRGWVM